MQQLCDVLPLTGCRIMKRLLLAASLATLAQGSLAAQKTDTFEYYASEHLKMSAVYWGCMAMELMGSLKLMDRDAIIRWVLSCQHKNGGFGVSFIGEKGKVLVNRGRFELWLGDQKQADPSTGGDAAKSGGAMQSASQAEKQYLAEATGHIPLRRMGAPKELGDVVAFLASERASYVTGTSMLVDGGLYRGAS